MELICKVVQLGTQTTGNSARGPWQKQELIVETMDTYPRKICLNCWNERVAEANSFFVGQVLTVQISIESREFNGKWYTDVRAIRFEQQPMQQQNAPQMNNQQPAYQQPAYQQPAYQQPMAQTQQPNFNQPNLPPVNEAYFSSDDKLSDDLPF